MLSLAHFSGCTFLEFLRFGTGCPKMKKNSMSKNFTLFFLLIHENRKRNIDITKMILTKSKLLLNHIKFIEG